MQMTPSPPVGNAAAPGRNMWIWVLLAVGGFFLLGLLACAEVAGGTFYYGYRNSQQASEKIDEIFQAAADEQQFDALYDQMTTSEYRNATPRESHKQMGQLIRDRLGRFKSKTARQTFRSMTNGRWRMNVEYDMYFEQGSGTLKSSLQWEDGEWKLLGWRLESPRLWAQTCPQCGAMTTINSAYCPSCGKMLQEGADGESEAGPTPPEGEGMMP